MSGGNENGKTSKHTKHAVSGNYFKTAVIFVLIAVIAIVCIVFSVNKSALAFVHKVEEALPMQVRDIEIDTDSDYISLEDDSENIEYGTLVANLSCENAGVNTSVYYGLNRVSLRYGAGVSGSDGSALFSQDGNTVIGGYDETYFMSLKYIEEGDTITVTTKDKILTYTVTETKIDVQGADGIDDSSGKLIVYSIYSDFSENSGNCFYVIAQKSGEEVIADEQ